MPLQDSDNFIVGRGTDSYKITYSTFVNSLDVVEDAPADGVCYVRQDNDWVDASTKYVVNTFSSYPLLP